MANLRTEIEIPSGEWTLIIDNKSAARVYGKKVLNDGYVTIAYDDGVSDPNAPLEPITPNTETVEGMVFENNEWIFSNSVAGYVWAAPRGDEDGLLVVT